MLISLSAYSVFFIKITHSISLAEQIFVGLSAAYWLVYTIYNILIPNLFNKLFTDFTITDFAHSYGSGNYDVDAYVSQTGMG